MASFPKIAERVARKLEHLISSPYRTQIGRPQPVIINTLILCFLNYAISGVSVSHFLSLNGTKQLNSPSIITIIHSRIYNSTELPDRKDSVYKLGNYLPLHNNFQSKIIQLMSEELPEYKQTFLKEMDQLRRKQFEEQEEAARQTMRATQQAPEAPPVNTSHQLWNQSQYSDSNWRSNLNQTYYRQQHNDNQFHLNGMLNPQVNRKKHNVRVTQISEYSNAKHNNTVFLNPKHSSC